MDSALMATITSTLSLQIQIEMTMIFILLLMVCCITSAAYHVPDEQYEIILQLVKHSEKKKQYPKAVKDRTQIEKSTIIKFWRTQKSEKKSSQNGKVLCHAGKLVVRRNEVKRVVKKTFKISKGSGYKKLWHTSKDGYSGLSQRDVLGITKQSKQ